MNEAASTSPAEPKRVTRNKIIVLRAYLELKRWWRESVVEDVDQVGCIQRIRSESLLTSRYIFMTAMSAGIAVLGLLLSSPAVVIGAMLLSPLMNPIVGTGFALATGDADWLRRCAKALVVGSVLAILFCALIVAVSPLQTVTEEIAARTRPNLFDLMVALFSALAGAYAMIRGREGTIVGVAIATALMPPLAVVGFGLATLNWAVFGGSLMLFVTNLVTIALAAAIMARLYGFRSQLSERESRFQSLAIAAAFIALAIPLALSLRQIAYEANGQRLVNNTVAEAFDPRAKVDQTTIDWDADPVIVQATVFTPEFRSSATRDITRRLSAQLDTEVQVVIDQFQVGADPGAAEQAALANARAQRQAEASEREVTMLVDRLATVAGVEKSAVTLDRQNRRALALADPIEGLNTAGYRALEERVAAQSPGWTIALRPPLSTLPDLAVEDDALADRAGESLALIAWAATRTGVPVRLTGRGAALEAAASRLREQGVQVSLQDGRLDNRIGVRWAVE